MSFKLQVGLIFGKFYPLHSGHVYLIEKALTQVDVLHIMLGCEEKRDLHLYEKSNLPRQPKVSDRYSWLQTTFKNRHNIHIHIHVLDESGIDEYPNGWQAWSQCVKDKLTEEKIVPTVIFTSEVQDVKNHEKYLGCPVKLIDAKRDFINISATMIRENPYYYWSYIAKAAQPFFVRKVAILGQHRFNDLPKQLANIYNTNYVVNGYINYIQSDLNTKGRPYLSESDFMKIVLLQADRLTKFNENANKILFTSIDFQTLADYYFKLFGNENAELKSLIYCYPFDLVINQQTLATKKTSLGRFEMVTNLVAKLL